MNILLYMIHRVIFPVIRIKKQYILLILLSIVLYSNTQAEIARKRAQELEEWRAIRREQDAAYQESLAIDQQKVGKI